MIKELREELREKLKNYFMPALMSKEYVGKDICFMCGAPLNTGKWDEYIEKVITALLPLFEKYAVSLVEVDEKKLRKVIRDITHITGDGGEGYLIDDVKDFANTLATSNIIKVKE